MKLEFELLLDSQYYHLEWMKKEHSLLEEPVLKMWSNYRNDVLMHPSIICEYIMSDLSLCRQNHLKKWDY